MVQSIENPRLYISNCHISIWMRNMQTLRMNRRHVHLIKRNQSHVRSLSAISLFRTTFFKNQISRSSISRENISIERRERKKKQHTFTNTILNSHLMDRLYANARLQKSCFRHDFSPLHCVSFSTIGHRSRIYIRAACTWN